MNSQQIVLNEKRMKHIGEIALLEKEVSTTNINAFAHIHEMEKLRILGDKFKQFDEELFLNADGIKYNSKYTRDQLVKSWNAFKSKLYENFIRQGRLMSPKNYIDKEIAVFNMKELLIMLSTPAGIQKLVDWRLGGERLDYTYPFTFIAPEKNNQDQWIAEKWLNRRFKIKQKVKTPSDSHN